MNNIDFLGGSLSLLSLLFPRLTLALALLPFFLLLPTRELCTQVSDWEVHKKQTIPTTGGPREAGNANAAGFLADDTYDGRVPIIYKQTTTAMAGF